jgi:UDP-3-O-[3-hydroxymyristoyl] glucosamine N-acyltransferase
MNRATPHTLGAIAARFDLELRGGDPALLIDGVDTLVKAGPTRIGFLANPRYRVQLADATAAAIVLRGSDADACPRRRQACTSMRSLRPARASPRARASVRCA